MIKTHTDIRNSLIRLWPSLNQIWLRDPAYFTPTHEELLLLLDQTITKDRPLVTHIADCDDFALQLHAEVSRLRYDYIREHLPPKEQRLPWPFGEASGLRFRGRDINHTINICLTTDGIYLIDATNQNLCWKAESGQDELFFIII